MKKFLLVTVLVLSMTCLFASNFNVSLGGGYGIKSIKFEKNDTEITNKISGLDVQLGVNYVLDNNMYIFGDFSMMFPKEQNFTMSFAAEEDDEDAEDVEYTFTKDDLKEDGSKFPMGPASYDDVKWNAMAFTLGAGYKFDINEDFNVLVGGGVRFDNNSIKLTFTEDDATELEADDTKISAMTIGLGVDIQGQYFFSQNFGAMLALKPNIGFYTKGDMGVFEDDDTENASKLSITFNAVVGAVARF